MPGTVKHAKHHHHHSHNTADQSLPVLPPVVAQVADQSGAGQPRPGKAAESIRKAQDAVADHAVRPPAARSGHKKESKSSTASAPDPAKTESKAEDHSAAVSQLKAEASRGDTGKKSSTTEASAPRKHHHKKGSASRKAARKAEREAKRKAEEARKRAEEARRKQLAAEFAVGKARYDQKAPKWKKSTSARIVSKMKRDPDNFKAADMITEVTDYQDPSRSVARKRGRAFMEGTSEFQEWGGMAADMTTNVMGCITPGLEDIVGAQQEAYNQSVIKAMLEPDKSGEKKIMKPHLFGEKELPKKQVSQEESLLKDLGISSAVITGIFSGLLEINGLVQDCIDFTHKYKKGNVTDEESFDFIKGNMAHIMTILSTVNGMAQPFVVAGSVASVALPIIGGILGIISGVTSLVGNMKEYVRGYKYTHRLRKQRSRLQYGLSDEIRRDREGKGNAGSAYLKQLGETKWMADASGNRGALYTLTQKQQIRDRSVGGIMRSIRTDEKVQKFREEMRGSHAPASEKDRADIEDALNRTEELDMVNELTRANELRRRESLLKVIAVDGMTIASNIAGLVPGAGQVANAGVQTAVGGVMSAKKLTVWTRQRLRNHGLWGADVNKSDRNKSIRRGRLARALYMKLYRFKESCTEDPTAIPDQFPQQAPAEGQGEKFARYGGMFDELQTLNTLIHATGVPGNIERSGNRDEMISVMKKGFYRDH